MIARAASLVAVLCIVTTASGQLLKELPKDVVTALREAEEFEVLAVDPAE